MHTPTWFCMWVSAAQTLPVVQSSGLQRLHLFAASAACCVSPCCCSLRSWDWHITVWALLLLLVGILPWYHSYRMFASSGENISVWGASRHLQAGKDLTN
jgi:hypothetical protein